MKELRSTGYFDYWKVFDELIGQLTFQTANRLAIATSIANYSSSTIILEK